jgi:hypothetical protein
LHRHLVAKVPVDLEDLLESAYGGPLQEELWSNPQIQVDVISVHMCAERTGTCAAVQGLQHRSLDLDEAAVMQRCPQASDDGRPSTHHLAGRRAHDQVGVTLTHPRLVTKIGMQGRQWPQGLCGQLPLVGEDAELAPAAGDHLAVHEYVVAEVDVGLPGRESIRADSVEAQHRLQAGAVALLQGGETELAGVADVHDPTGHPDDVVGLRACLEVAMALTDLGERVRARHRYRVRIDTCASSRSRLARRTRICSGTSSAGCSLTGSG